MRDLMISCMRLQSGNSPQSHMTGSLSSLPRCWQPCLLRRRRLPSGCPCRCRRRTGCPRHRQARPPRRWPPRIRSAFPGPESYRKPATAPSSQELPKYCFFSLVSPLLLYCFTSSLCVKYIRLPIPGKERRNPAPLRHRRLLAVLSHRAVVRKSFYQSAPFGRRR